MGWLAGRLGLRTERNQSTGVTLLLRRQSRSLSRQRWLTVESMLRLQAKVEIVVREGELGETVVATVNQLGATTLVVGLHDKSFLYR